MSLDLGLYMKSRDVDEWDRVMIADENGNEQEYERVCDLNITHNLGTMASHVPCGGYTLYDLLWRPDEHGFEKVTMEYVTAVASGLAFMIPNRRMLEGYDASNGWGDYDGLVKFVQDYCHHLSYWNDGEEWLISADR